MNANEIGARLATLDVPMAILGTSDGMTLAYHGVDQEMAEKASAAFAMFTGVLDSSTAQLGRGGLDSVVMCLPHCAIVVTWVTVCTQLLVVVDSDQVSDFAARSAQVADHLAELLPDELPHCVGAMHLHRPAKQGAA
ncbi:hypothetical protein BJF83_22925 [Nocardiopsis sp. CNR-923]|uniref:hypothetical protein n=1 Tax=Nocardiopsis sp. CNR-923 TaxID=1904965 RepID=UPI000967CD27|nr:hypothetical protein [Nocardiopsis sp. CNR-923]OLT25415.1 hypothetical protein BJF83_22925 [Nocardiopsis sp. CNR-923]